MASWIAARNINRRYCIARMAWRGVQREDELQSDLILLDTLLPEMEGIEAIRRIAEVTPNSVIILLSASAIWA